MAGFVTVDTLVWLNNFQDALKNNTPVWRWFLWQVLSKVQIYKFKLKAHQEDLYQHHWHKIANFFIETQGAIGSCLHKGDDGLWIAYSRWPNKETRDASWTGEGEPDNKLPDDINHSIQVMRAIKKENSDLENHYEEICLNVINDLLCIPKKSLA